MRTRFVSVVLGAASLGMVAAMPAIAEEAFTYDCETCPTNWGNLPGENFAQCIEGDAQSPIAYDEETAQRKRLPRLRPRFGESVLEVERLGTNFEAFVEAGSGFTRVGRKRFELIQYHFHSASEHVVNGERFPLEMHFVHRASDGALAVLAVLIKEGEELEEIEPLIEALPAVAMADVGESVEVETIDVSELLPDTRKSFRYTGSTTTPPCAPNVSWIILAKPLEMSAEQIEAIQDTIRGFNSRLLLSGKFVEFDNNRPIQDRNGRVVMTDTARDGDKDKDDD